MNPTLHLPLNHKDPVANVEPIHALLLSADCQRFYRWKRPCNDAASGRTYPAFGSLSALAASHTRYTAGCDRHTLRCHSNHNQIVKDQTTRAFCSVRQIGRGRISLPPGYFRATQTRPRPIWAPCEVIQPSGEKSNIAVSQNLVKGPRAFFSRLGSPRPWPRLRSCEE